MKYENTFFFPVGEVGGFCFEYWVIIWQFPLLAFQRATFDDAAVRAAKWSRCDDGHVEAQQVESRFHGDWWRLAMTTLRTSTSIPTHPCESNPWKSGAMAAGPKFAFVVWGSELGKWIWSRDVSWPWIQRLWLHWWLCVHTHTHIYIYIHTHTQYNTHTEIDIVEYIMKIN